MKSMPQDVEVRLTLLRTEDGGRSSPLIASASYRPQFHYDGQDWDSVVEISARSVAPGESTIAIVSFLSPDRHIGRLDAGSPFLIREGPRIVAYGAVTRLLNLAQSAHHATSRSAG